MNLLTEQDEKLIEELKNFERENEGCDRYLHILFDIIHRLKLVAEKLEQQRDLMADRLAEMVGEAQGSDAIYSVTLANMDTEIREIMEGKK